MEKTTFDIKKYKKELNCEFEKIDNIDTLFYKCAYFQGFLHCLYFELSIITFDEYKDLDEYIDTKKEKWKK